MTNTHMKAAVVDRYCPPGTIQVRDVEKPTPRDNEVLIKVRAASVNPLDCGLIKGRPFIFRLLFGLRKPRITRPGRDVAGTVEGVGRNVSQFKTGDPVFGVCTAGSWMDKAGGSFAEYACTSESALVGKPDNVTFEQAASAPVAALTALQGLRDQGKIRPEFKVLINGATGGVGTFAMQIAKSFGANVTAVCRASNVEIARSAGADRVFDYTKEDYTTSGQSYDLIFDLVGNHSLAACRRALNPNGILVMAGTKPSGHWMIPMMGRLITALVLSRFMSQKFVMFVAKLNKKDLIVIAELMAAGKMTPVIDRCYSLSEVCEAIRYMDRGHARGKVIITLD